MSQFIGFECCGRGFAAYGDGHMTDYAYETRFEIYYRGSLVWDGSESMSLETVVEGFKHDLEGGRHEEWLNDIDDGCV